MKLPTFFTVDIGETLNWKFPMNIAIQKVYHRMFAQSQNHIVSDIIYIIPVVPHKAVAEVSE